MKRDTRPKGREVDLGLAISGATLPPGQIRDFSEIARYCGCSKQCIHAIYTRALRKLHRALSRQGIRSFQDIQR